MHGYLWVLLVDGVLLISTHARYQQVTHVTVWSNEQVTQALDILLQGRNSEALLQVHSDDEHVR